MFHVDEERGIVTIDQPLTFRPWHVSDVVKAETADVLRRQLHSARYVARLLAHCEGLDRNPWHVSNMGAAEQIQTMERQRSLCKVDARWRAKGIAPPTILLRDPDEQFPSTWQLRMLLAATIA